MADPEKLPETDDLQPLHDAELRHPEVDFEADGLSTARVASVLAAFALIFVLVGCVSWVIVTRHRSVADFRQKSTYSTPEEPLPGEPKLESLEAVPDDLPPNVFARQLAMERRLNSYGKTTEDGYVHVPIKEAIQHAASTLPVRKEPADAMNKSYGLLGGGEPNSGRVYLKPPQWFNESP